MPNRSLTVDQVLSLLEATPARLAALAAGVAPPVLRARPGGDEWSANEVLAHLRACADVWGDCIARVVAEDKPTLRAVNPVTRIKQTDYVDLEFRPSLEAFAAERAELLAILKPLPAEGWSRAATVTGAGKPLERTVLFYGQWLGGQERPHIWQVARAVKAAVGFGLVGGDRRTVRET